MDTTGYERSLGIKAKPIKNKKREKKKGGFNEQLKIVSKRDKWFQDNYSSFLQFSMKELFDAGYKLATEHALEIRLKEYELKPKEVKYLECGFCDKADVSVETIYDPYEQDTNNKKVLVNICNTCYTRKCEDI